ncbi:MAG: ABC transporter permease [Terriglobales bacterium]
MNPIAAVARNTFREAIRDRILFSLVFFAAAMIGAAILFTQMSFAIDAEALINFSLTALTLFGIIIAVFLGNQLVAKEIERRTLYTLLAHPVRRWQFVLGKYAGLLLTLLVNCGLMALAFVLALSYVLHGTHPGEGNLAAALLFIFLQLALVTALALLFSCFSSPVLAAVFSLALFLVGNFADDLRAMGRTTQHVPAKLLALGCSYLLPNFSDLNVVTAASHFQPIRLSLVFLNTGYVVVYAGALLLAACAILEGRDLK